MLRKLLAGAAMLGLAAALVPTPAPAQQGGAVVFTGQATVGAGAYAGATGEGLCFPGRQNTAGCPPGGALAQAAQSWSFLVPNPTDPGPLPPICKAYGVIAGTVLTGSNCTIVSSGSVGPNAAGVGPSCGMSYGDSTDGPPDTFDPDGPGGVPAQPIFVQWITSAGGTLPITGTFAGVPFAGVVQARPLQPGACNTTPATQFSVVGVTVTATAG